MYPDINRLKGFSLRNFDQLFASQLEHRQKMYDDPGNTHAGIEHADEFDETIRGPQFAQDDAHGFQQADFRPVFAARPAMGNDAHEALEIRVAHQDQAIEDLNRTIIAQWKEIDRLTRELVKLSDRLASAEQAIGPDPGDEPPPPHW